MRVSRLSGFSLIEVLVALAVLAMVLGAVVKATGAFAGNTAYLRDRTLAHWVAMNVVTEQRVQKEWPGLGSRSGSERMGGLSWHWRLTVSETPVPGIRRLDVEVFRDPERKTEPISRIQGYVGRS